MKRRTLLRVLVVCGVLAAVTAAAAWTATGDDPIAVSRFSLTSDGTEIAIFSDLGGISSGIDPSALELAGGTIKLPGKRVPPSVTLTRGMTNGAELWSWQDAALSGAAGGRKDADLVMYASDGTPVARYHLQNAWPSKLQIGALKAGASEVLLETVTLVCEHIQRVPV
jgi:phage tail-like protein